MPALAPGLSSASSGGTSMTSYLLNQVHRDRKLGDDSGSSACTPMIEKNLTPAQAEMVDKVITDLQRSHWNEVEMLKDKVDATELEASIRLEKLVDVKAELATKVDKTAAAITAKEQTQETLVSTRHFNAELEDERDALRDKVVGVEAKLATRQKRQAEDVAMEANVKAELQEELHVTRQNLELQKQHKYLLEEEARCAQKEEVVEAAAAKLTVLGVKEELIEMSLGMEPGPSPQIPTGTKQLIRGIAAVVETPGVIDLLAIDDEDELRRKKMETLEKTVTEKRKMREELATVRLDIMAMQRDREVESSAMKREKGDTLSATMMADSSAMMRESGTRLSATNMGGASSTVYRAGQHAKARAARKQKAAQKMLRSIDEEEFEIMSEAASFISGQVSSDGGNGVADLNDFDDAKDSSLEADARIQGLNAKVATLKEELKEAKHQNEMLQEDLNGMDAEMWSKIGHLKEQVWSLREIKNESEDQIIRISQSKQDEVADAYEELRAVTNRLLIVQRHKEAQEEVSERKAEEQSSAYQADMDALKQQLTFALEARRMDAIRLEDTKRAFVAVEEQHQRVVSDLNARLNMASGGDSSGFMSGQLGFIEKLHELEEERNVLRNELECVMVQWRSMFENEQHNRAVDVANWKRAEKELAEAIEEHTKLEETIADLKRQVAEEKEKLSDEQDLSASREAAAASVTLWSFLRCPSRSDSTGLRVVRAAGENKEDALSLQNTVWKICQSMGGLTAMLCGEKLNILDASKRAFTMWGSAALRGSSFATLIYDKAAADWLKAEIDDSSGLGAPVPATEFWLRELGCVEFRSKLGSPFDSTVTCARLPAEKEHSKEATFLMILEPLEDTQRPSAPPKQSWSSQYSQMSGSRRIGSRPSSVISDDINPNDSVSQINAY
eukprot:TRINITY_DN20671_c0_g1_i1.p1 TRINITY_DN20671_c0_g1~~TRINITY_DN20671_c0_g1_i1.p1  ORF type:complete len:1022 (-),score=273.92 TRINITY_DN20671_c0_g1_i1:48-2756(-)